MSSDNPLEPVYKAFEVARDSFKVAVRTVREQYEPFIRRTQFVGATPEEAEAALELASQQASDLAVLALFATFERYVIEHLQAANERLAAGHPAEYSRKLAEKFKAEVEYWRFDDILDLFKPEVDTDLIGQVKQIKRYRDWIAHRNSGRPVPTQATPATAYEVLSKLIDEIRKIHVLPAPVPAA
ncbi:hypothetical protein [Cupriavidus pauculus]|uniref:hypothetical protein n=1 Tax=Cupriavidus pauculus TaxID=82633 RepID=UPI001247A6C4|nr:hypothetical protein [Cupriavidus pauculus]KAB0596394.1 hypothetical protein F7R19_27675 [Cupriavidus pauculus]MBY4733385.1 hypothetical protein [Cupriavidus pauculus]UAL03869.1 hypothetical protein K8O84_28535 [Cupriavidus pauculus]